MRRCTKLVSIRRAKDRGPGLYVSIPALITIQDQRSSHRAIPQALIDLV